MKVAYPHTTTVAFMETVDALAAMGILGLGDDVKQYMAAQWALECGWGTSRLAIKHRNYAGMKWRDIMKSVAVPVKYDAHDGTERYCQFATNKAFVEGFILRLDKLGPYDGWRDAARYGGEDYIKFVGPIWLGLSPAQNQEYINKIRGIVDRHFK